MSEWPVSARSRPIPADWEWRSGWIASRPHAAPQCRDARGAVVRREAALTELASTRTGATPSSRPANGSPPRARYDAACSGALTSRGAKAPVRRRRGGELGMSGWGRGSSRRGPRSRAGADRGGCGRPRQPEPRASLRSGRRHCLGRRALAHRACTCRRRGRRDDRLRRDRRRDRRSHRAQRCRRAAASREPRAGADDHSPSPDRERRRQALSRREGARRPDPHADHALDDAQRRDELERMLGGGAFVTA